MMKKTSLWLLCAALMLSLCGCQPAPAPVNTGDKSAFSRRFVTITPTVWYGGMEATLRNDNTPVYSYTREEDDGGNTAVVATISPETAAETPVYELSFEYGVTPYPTSAPSLHGNTLWWVMYQEGNTMFGGTDPDRQFLQAIDTTTDACLNEWNLTALGGAQLTHVPMATSENTAYLLVECEQEGTTTFAVVHADATTGQLSDPYTISDATARPTLFTLNDGRAAVAYNGTVLPFAKGTVTPEAALTPAVQSEDAMFFTGDNQHPFLYVIDDTLYGNGTQPLLHFAEWGVNLTESTLCDLHLHNGALSILVNEHDLLGLYTLTPCTPAEAAAPLLVAGYRVSDGIHKAVKAFNRTQSEYTARVEDYIQYDGGNILETYATRPGVIKLNTELLAGSDFDLLCLNEFLSSSALIRQGALLDLYPLMDAGDRLTRDSFVQGVLSQTETSGHLYSLSAAFGIRTLTSDRRVIGEYSAFSVEDWHALQAAFPTATLTDMSEENFLNYLVRIAPHDFVTGTTAQFNTATFERYLETMASLESSEEKLAHLQNNVGATHTTLANGSHLVMQEYVRNFSAYQWVLSDLIDGAQFLGYPTENGTGHLLEFANTLGILSASDKQEAAWQFLQLAVKEAAPAPGTNMVEQAGFPTDRAAFEAELTYYRDPENFTVESGNEYSTPLGAPLCALTEADVAQLYALIENAKPVLQTDRALFDILTDETLHFLNGESTKTDTAKRIQERVQLYLNEQQ